MGVRMHRYLSRRQRLMYGIYAFGKKEKKRGGGGGGKELVGTRDDAMSPSGAVLGIHHYNHPAVFKTL